MLLFYYSYRQLDGESSDALSHYFTETPIRLHKCHKRELQEIRREEIDELREKVIEMEEMQKKQIENEKPVDMMADIWNKK